MAGIMLLMLWDIVVVIAAWTAALGGPLQLSDFPLERQPPEWHETPTPTPIIPGWQQLAELDACDCDHCRRSQPQDLEQPSLIALESRASLERICGHPVYRQKSDQYQLAIDDFEVDEILATRFAREADEVEATEPLPPPPLEWKEKEVAYEIVTPRGKIYVRGYSAHLERLAVLPRSSRGQWCVGTVSRSWTFHFPREHAEWTWSPHDSGMRPNEFAVDDVFLGNEPRLQVRKVLGGKALDFLSEPKEIVATHRAKELDTQTGDQLGAIQIHPGTRAFWQAEVIASPRNDILPDAGPVLAGERLAASDNFTQPRNPLAELEKELIQPAVDHHCLSEDPVHLDCPHGRWDLSNSNRCRCYQILKLPTCDCFQRQLWGNDLPKWAISKEEDENSGFVWTFGNPLHR